MRDATEFEYGGMSVAVWPVVGGWFRWVIRSSQRTGFGRTREMAGSLGRLAVDETERWPAPRWATENWNAVADPALV